MVAPSVRPSRPSCVIGSALAALSIAAMVAMMSCGPYEAASATPSGEDPYVILGVQRNANRDAIQKAYRGLAKRWHPDRNGGDSSAEAAFASIASAYEVLLDPEKREVFDRLGAGGLERLRDGDPSVDKEWLPPDEVLRRLHDDGDEAWHAYLVTSSFAAIGSLLSALDHRTAPMLRWVLGSEFPTVAISATDAAGATLASGGSTSTSRAGGGVTFKFELSGISRDFGASDVTHNCGARAKFLGMKRTYYLQCGEMSPGIPLSVSVAAATFSVTNRRGLNVPSQVFVLEVTM